MNTNIITMISCWFAIRTVISVDDSGVWSSASDGTAGDVDTGGVGTEIGWGTGPMNNSDGKAVAEIDGWFVANGGGGTGTGIGRRSKFSGCVDLSNVRTMPLISGG